MRTIRVTRIPALAVLASLLLTASPASALYIATPLSMTPSASEADVGDEITLDISRNSDDESPSLAGKTLTLRYSYDPHEGAREEGPGAPDEESSFVEREVTNVTLDEKESASIKWTVPAEVDDRNAFLVLVDADGQTVAHTTIRVGDAPALMMIAASGPSNELDDGSEPVETPLANERDDGAVDADTKTDDAQPAGDANVPSIGLLALVGVGALVAIALRRR